MVDTLRIDPGTTHRGLLLQKIVSEAVSYLMYTTGADTDLANCLSSPEEYVTGRHREARF